MASTAASSFDTGHEDMIHDAQLDYYGKRLATASSDRTVKIFDVHEGQHIHLATLQGHEGPVWEVSWAHPKFGNILASCSYDRKVIVWKEETQDQWIPVFSHEMHSSSVNSVSWAPHEFGLVLACASSDGSVSVISHRADDTWQHAKIDVDSIGVNSVSWAPAPSPASLVTSGVGPTPVKRFVSGGCDGKVKIFRCDENGQWTQEQTLDQHTDWVRDVAWAPNLGLPSNTIASCSQDRRVIIWNQDNHGAEWTPRALPEFPAAVWRLSWSLTGNILAVSGADNKVSLWKESVNGEWQNISAMNETGNLEMRN